MVYSCTISAVFVLCLFLMTVTVVTVAEIARVPVNFTRSETWIQSAKCSTHNKRVLSLHLKQGGRVLEKLNTRCTRPPCQEQVVQWAVRGSQTLTHSQLVIAWKRSYSLNLEDDPLVCTADYIDTPREDIAASVRTVQATELRWLFKKRHLSPNASLIIEVKDDLKGWKPVGRRDNKPARQTSFISFYDRESEDVTIMKVVDNAETASLTVLVSEDSPLPSDPDKWRCKVRVAGYDKDCEEMSSPQQRQSFWSKVPKIALLIVIAVLLLVLIVCAFLIAILCKRKKIVSSCGCDSAAMLRTPTQLNDEDGVCKDIALRNEMQL